MVIDRTTSWWKIILLLVSGTILFLVLYSLAQYIISTNEDVTIPFSLLLSVLIVGMYVLSIRLIEKKWTSSLDFRRMLPDVLLGGAVGIVLFLLVSVTLFLLGCYKIISVHYSDRIITLFSFYLLVACSEEVVFRGIIFRLLDRKWGQLSALIVSALLFGFLHIFNENATIWSSIAIAIEAGVMLAVAFKFSGTLWVPIGIHWLWNFVQGQVFGFSVSGNDFGDSLLIARIEGPDLITGGSFGAEASLITVIFAVLLTAYMLYLQKKRIGFQNNNS